MSILMKIGNWFRGGVTGYTAKLEIRVGVNATSRKEAQLLAESELSGIRAHILLYLKQHHQDMPYQDDLTITIE